MCNAKSTPRPMRMAENTIESSCKCPTDTTTHPKLHAIPMTSALAAMSGNRTRRKTPINIAVIRMNATMDEMVESLAACAVSSDSMAGIPVTPQAMSSCPLALIHSAAAFRSAASESAIPAMEPSVGAVSATRTVRMRPVLVVNGCHCFARWPERSKCTGLPAMASM